LILLLSFISPLRYFIYSRVLSPWWPRRYSVLYNKSNYSRSLIGSYYDLLEDRRSEDVINTFFISQLYKTDRFLVAVLLFIIDYRRRHATCTTFILLLHISASSLITEQTHGNMEPIRLDWLFTDYSSIIGNDQWLINFEDAAKRKQEEREVRWRAAPPPRPHTIPSPLWPLHSRLVFSWPFETRPDLFRPFLLPFNQILFTSGKHHFRKALPSFFI